MVMQPTVVLEVGGSIPGRLTFVGAGATAGRLGFKPPTYTSAVGSFTARPLRVLQ